MESPAMNRRALLQLLALGGVGTVTLRSFPVTGWTPTLLTPHQDRTVAEITELIIPQTDTAGAKAAGVDQFIDAVIADADAAERDRFLQGLDWIDARARERYGTDFVSSTSEQRTALIARVAAPTAGTPAVGVEFFKNIKALTITGYYTSKIGMREELGDDGRTAFADYVGCTHPEHKVSV